MKARIRDFLVTKQDWIFSVVSYELRDEGAVKSLIRYVPDERGERVSERGRYRKLDFHEGYKFLMLHHPEYVKEVHVVPKCDIKAILRPDVRLPVIAEREEEIMTIYDLLREHVPKDTIGITGSFLCGLNGEGSDYDFVVYGRKNFNTVRAVIEKAKEGATIHNINEAMWSRIYAKRKPELSYEEFVTHEQRKSNRGVIGSTYFDLLYVRDRTEMDLFDHRIYVQGAKKGYATITAEVKDASFSFDSPAIYEIDHPKINEVLSFTHTYTGQALEGETIEVRGVLEQIGDETRLVVGTTREAKGEWIKSLSLIENSSSH